MLRSESRNLYEKVSELKIHHARQRQLILGEYQVQDFDLILDKNGLINKMYLGPKRTVI